MDKTQSTSTSELCLSKCIYCFYYYYSTTGEVYGKPVVDGVLRCIIVAITHRKNNPLQNKALH